MHKGLCCACRGSPKGDNLSHHVGRLALAGIRHIDEGAISPAVHGIGAVLALSQDGLAIALVAYSRTNGSLGGILQTYFQSLDPSVSFEPGPFTSLFQKADWILAHGARETKPPVVALLPVAERKPWVCSRGILEWHNPQAQEHMELADLLLLQRHGAGSSIQGVPSALNLVLGMVVLLNQKGRLGDALQRAGYLPSTGLPKEDA